EGSSRKTAGVRLWQRVLTFERSPLCETQINNSIDWPLGQLATVCCHHGIIVEVHIAVGLRPQPDTAGDRCRKFVLQIELAVEIAFDLLAGNADLEVVPDARRSRRVANPFHR